MTRSHFAGLVLVMFAFACGSSGGTDGGTTGTTDGGTSGQMDSGTLGHPDSGTPTGTDAGMPKLSCVGINNCLQSCTTSACEQTCVNDGTATGQSLFNAVQMCFQMACPQTSTGPCAMPSSTTCQMCVQQSQMQGGQCVNQVNACEMDMSGSSGGTTGGGTDGGMQNTTCNALLQCINACTTQTCAQNCFTNSSMSAQSLFQQLDNCLFMTACPDTDGGTCSMQTTACDMCLQMAQMMGGQCYSQLQACQNG